jgi:hypothetical protein
MNPQLAGQANTLGSVISPAITLAIVLLLVVSRVRGRPLQPARLLTGDLILLAIGLGALIPESHTIVHGIDYLIVGADLLDSLVLGTIRGFTVRLYERDGVPWYRYGLPTVVWWVVSILIRVALAVLGSAHHASPLSTGGDLLFMLGLALLCQNLVVIRRQAGRRRENSFARSSALANDRHR